MGTRALGVVPSRLVEDEDDDEYEYD